MKGGNQPKHPHPVLRERRDAKNGLQAPLQKGVVKIVKETANVERQYGDRAMGLEGEDLRPDRQRRGIESQRHQVSPEPGTGKGESSWHPSGHTHQRGSVEPSLMLLRITGLWFRLSRYRQVCEDGYH